MCKSHNKASLLRDMKIMSRDKSVDLTEVLSCRATLFERSRHNLSSLRQVSSMWHHKPDLLLFRSIAGTGCLLSKHALGISGLMNLGTFKLNQKNYKITKLIMSSGLYITRPLCFWEEWYRCIFFVKKTCWKDNLGPGQNWLQYKNLCFLFTFCVEEYLCGTLH